MRRAPARGAAALLPAAAVGAAGGQARRDHRHVRQPVRAERAGVGRRGRARGRGLPRRPVQGHACRGARRPTTRTSRTWRSASSANGSTWTGVNAVTDIIQAAVQLAVQSVMAEKNRIALFPGGTARLANEACAPATSVLWMWDTYGQAVGIAKPLAKPGSKWFMIAADYAFGQQLVADATGLVGEGRRRGGGLGAAPVQLRRRLLALPDAGAGVGRGRDRARQHRDGPDQHPQAGARVRDRRRRQADGRQLRADRARHRRPGPADGAGRHRERGVLLGPRRRHPRLRARFMDRHHAAPSTIQAGVYSVTLHY